MEEKGMELWPDQTRAEAPEVLREALPMERFVGAVTTRAVVEGEVALPGGLREETNVLCCEAMAVLERTEAQEGRVSAEGKAVFHVLYTQGDPTRVNALEASADFTHAAELPPSAPGMSAPASLMVEHASATAQGGRLKLMAIVRVHARAFTDEPLEAVTGLRGAEGLMVRAETLTGLETVARGAKEALVRDECELGAVLQITDTLYATAIATVREAMGGEERATVSGNILLEVTHLSAMPSRPVAVTRHSIPFEESMPLVGEPGDALLCDAVVKDVAVLSQDGAEEGARTLRAEVLLGLSARCTRKRELRLMLDAYTTAGPLMTPQTRMVSRVLSYQNARTAESGKLTLLMDGQAPVRTPLRAALRPVITDTSRAGGKLAVEGVMETTLMYMTDGSDAPRAYQTEEPFRAAFACELCQPESLTLAVSDAEAVGVTSDRVEIKYILHLSCDDVKLGEEPLVTDVRETPAEPPEPGVLMCFAQAGETLWDVAKRYRVSCESLKRMNPELEDGAAPERVILWRK